MTENADWAALGPEWWAAFSRRVPPVPLTDAIRRTNQYPATITSVAAEGVSQQVVFDPSMKQHQVALRASEPRFADEAEGARWYRARRAAASAVLETVAGSAFADRLVLRGSTLMKMWFGDAAREPGDLDFVVQGTEWTVDGLAAGRLFDEIAREAGEASRRGGVVDIDADGALSDEIWTYDRVPGRRLVLPWSAEGCPDGSVQIDFVFGEPVPEPPELVEITTATGETTCVLGASRGLSLAWKLLWLFTDAYPQGKDLYDALLLAESTPLRHELLYEVFAAADVRHTGIAVTSKAIGREFVSVDWDAFEADYPQLRGDDEDLARRLLAALEPTFAASDTSATEYATEYRQRIRWLTPLIERCRTAQRGGGADAVHARLAQDLIPLETAIVVLRELGLMGSAMKEATTVFGAPAWRNWRHGLLASRWPIVHDAIADLREAEGGDQDGSGRPAS